MFLKIKNVGKIINVKNVKNVFFYIYVKDIKVLRHDMAQQ